MLIFKSMLLSFLSYFPFFPFFTAPPRARQTVLWARKLVTLSPQNSQSRVALPPFLPPGRGVPRAVFVGLVAVCFLSFMTTLSAATGYLDGFKMVV